MKLLFDENVSHRLPHSLAGEFPGSTHVRTAGLRGADDGQIWDYARDQGFAVVSKDTDFRKRSYVDGYKLPKLEHQIVNIRHIEHHMAQLADRLRSSAGIGIQWVGACRGTNSTAE